MSNRQHFEIARPTLIALLAIAALGAALVAGVGAGLLTRAGLDPNLARAIAFSMLPLLLYPYFRARAVMRNVEFPTPFWKWAIVWVTLMFAGYLVVVPAVLRWAG